MPRLITLLLLLVALAIVAMQNLATSLPLVILSSETPAIPVGILLVGAVCMGAFITVILYGLVGLGRPPESKYRPMGQRVPYPESPGSTTLPPSGPAPGPSPSASGSSYASGSSSAFVSSPPAQKPTAPAVTPAATPTDSPVNSPSTPAKGSSFKRHFGSNAPTPPVPDSGASSSTPSSSTSSAPISGLKDSTDSVKKKLNS